MKLHDIFNNVRSIKNGSDNFDAPFSIIKARLTYAQFFSHSYTQCNLI